MKLYGDFFWTITNPRRFGRRLEDVRESYELTGRVPLSSDSHATPFDLIPPI